MNKIWRPSNVYKTAILGQNISVGRFTEIGDQVRVGDNTRIGAHCFIPAGVTIGKNVFVAPCVTMTNDRLPPSPKEKWEKTIIEDGAAIGAGCVLLCGIVIGANSTIGCGSVVTKSVPPNEIWAGNPARKLRDKP